MTGIVTYNEFVQLQVEHLSPKICYFANETVTNRYQISVILCKSADDSYKLVNLLQHKIDSQGYYRAHSHWLQNGKFSNPDKQLSPKTKRKTIASVEMVSSPKQGAKFGWGVSQSNTLSQISPTLDSTRDEDVWGSSLWDPQLDDRSLEISRNGPDIPQPATDASKGRSELDPNELPIVSEHSVKPRPESALCYASEGTSEQPSCVGMLTPEPSSNQAQQSGDARLCKEESVVMRKPRAVNCRRPSGNRHNYCK